jgi:hypothetical protein
LHLHHWIAELPNPGFSTRVQSTGGSAKTPEIFLVLDAMFQECRVAAIGRSTYEIDLGTGRVIFQCRRNLAIDKKWPIFRDWQNTQSSGAVKKRWFDYEVVVGNLRCKKLQVFFSTQAGNSC